ncbi:MAG TPA: LEA type 2 family protein [Flavitalea sp.]|nr:LEA type 2 family protein [Flavitalea sp.]
MRILTILVVSALLAGSCTKPKDLEFIDIHNVKMLKWGLAESLVGVNARFYNPNNQRVQLKDADVAIYINSGYMGNSLMDSTITIPKKDTFDLPIVIKVKTATAISQVLESLSDSAVAFKVEGKVKMGKSGVFLTYPVRYEGIQKMKDLETM